MRQTNSARILRGSHELEITAITIASGKGGVGKTNAVANLATSLALNGWKVVVLDADFGLSNLDVLLGLSPRYHIGHFLSGEKALDEILIEGPAGVQILPAASGLQGLTAMTDTQRHRLLLGLDQLRGGVDFLFIDTAAGISTNVTELLAASGRSIVVTDPEPTSLVDAYALIKVMQHIQPDRPLELLVNSVRSESEAIEVFQQIRKAARHFLSSSVELFGWVARDPLVQQAVRSQKLVVLEYPMSPASQSFERLAQRLSSSAEIRATLSTNLLPFPESRSALDAPE